MKTYWYLTRASGAVSLILLTLTVAIGIALLGRWRSGRWPRFAVDGVHRTASLLAIVFLAIHIVTAVLDSFAPISLIDAVIPFVGTYRPLWLGLGATAFDLLLAVVLTSAVRARLGLRAWRAVHWLAYGSWPVAMLHGLGTGSDVRQTWMTVVEVICAAAFVIAVLARIAIGWPDAARWRLAGAGALGGFVIGVAIWLPAGPLASNWARRSGDPAGGSASHRDPREARVTLPRLLDSITAAPMTHERHLAVHGELPSLRGQPAVDELARSGLRGRGGGAFPLARKLETVRRARGRPLVVANGCEGEPMSAKDRVLLGSLPHLVIDGALCVARAVGAHEIVIAIDEGNVRGGETIEWALSQRPEPTLEHLEVSVAWIPSGYVSGQETAIVRWCNDGVAKPWSARRRVGERGIGRRPTLVSNVETLAHVALIARHGADWFSALGADEDPGSALVTVGGAVRRPGVYEIDHSIGLRALVDLAGGCAERPARLPARWLRRRVGRRRRRRTGHAGACGPGARRGPTGLGRRRGPARERVPGRRDRSRRRLAGGSQRRPVRPLRQRPGRDRRRAARDLRRIGGPPRAGRRDPLVRVERRPRCLRASRRRGRLRRQRAARLLRRVRRPCPPRALRRLRATPDPARCRSTASGRLTCGSPSIRSPATRTDCAPSCCPSWSPSTSGATR